MYSPLDLKLHFLAWKFQDALSFDLCRLIHNYSPLHFHPHILIKLCKHSVIGFCSHCCFSVFSCSISPQLCYYSADFHSSLIHLSLIYGVTTMCEVPYCGSRSRDTEQSQDTRKARKQVNDSRHKESKEAGQ